MPFFRKKQKHKEEQTEMTTLEQVKKAYADLSDEDKKSFHQSIQSSQTTEDKIDESVAAQERADGNQDTQTAKDRIHEMEGEEKALEEKHEESHEEHQDDRDEAHEDRIEQLFQEVKAINARLDALSRDPQPVSKDTGDELDKLVSKYSN